MTFSLSNVLKKPSVFLCLLGVALILQCTLFSSYSFSNLSIGVYCIDQNSLHKKAVLRILTIFGISYQCSHNFVDLLDHNAICVVGPLPEYVLSKKELQSMYSYVENGGTILCAGEIGTSLYRLIGIDSLSAKQTRFSIVVKQPVNDPLLAYVDQPQEMIWRLGNNKKFNSTVWTFGAHVNGCEILAQFDDKTSALSKHTFNKGTVYYLGIGWDNAVLLAQSGGDFEAQKEWINAFEPTTDMFMLLLKSLYQQYTYPSFTCNLYPNNAKSALLLSHDIDTRTGFEHALEFAALEKNLSVSATYYACTKFFTDETDTGYFNKKSLILLDSLQALGGRIGSHSVSHSTQFSLLPIGDSINRIQNYKPWKNKTIFGEVQVSKWFLEKVATGVSSFRSPGLAYPVNMITVLEKTGFTSNSSISACDYLCNFPFFALGSKDISSIETKIVEIPLTLDCSQGYLTEVSAPEVIKKWSSIITLNKDNGAMTTLLIHTDTTAFKLQTELDLIKAVQSNELWIGDIDSYAQFFRKRAEMLLFNASVRNQTLFLDLGIDYKTIPEGLSITVKGYPWINKIQVRDKKMVKLTADFLIENDELTMYNMAKDLKLYQLQKKLVFIVCILFSVLIFGLSFFFLIQRAILFIDNIRKKPQQLQNTVTDILFGQLNPATKIIRLRNCGQTESVSNIIIDNMDFVKGEIIEELSLIYTSLGFFENDIKELKSYKWWLRANAARRLAKITLSDAIPHLLPLLSDKKQEVRLAAAFAISRYNDPHAIPLLIKAINKSDRWTAEILVGFLKPFAEHAVSLCADIVKNNTSPINVKTSAVETLGNLRDHHCVPLLIDTLRQNHENMIKNFSSEPTQKVPNQITLARQRLLLHEYTAAIIIALGKIGDDTTLDTLLDLLSTVSSDHFRYVCDSIKKIGNPTVIPKLIRSLKTVDTYRAEIIIDTIAHIGTEGSVHLFDLLHYSDDSIVRMSLHYLEKTEVVMKQIETLREGAENEKNYAKDSIQKIVQTGYYSHLVDIFALPENMPVLKQYSFFDKE